MSLGPVAAWGIVALSLFVALAGCAEPAPGNASPLRMRSSHATTTIIEQPGPDLGTDSRVVEGEVTCSVANRFFWFPDTTRSCASANAKTLTIARHAVRIDVEMSWAATQPAARNLTLGVFAGDDSIELDRTSGPSSLHISLGERVTRNHFSDGGQLRVQVDAATGVLGADYDVDVAAAFAQEYTLAVTTTYELVG